MPDDSLRTSNRVIRTGHTNRRLPTSNVPGSVTRRGQRHFQRWSWRKSNELPKTYSSPTETEYVTSPYAPPP